MFVTHELPDNFYIIYISYIFNISHILDEWQNVFEYNSWNRYLGWVCMREGIAGTPGVCDLGGVTRLDGSRYGIHHAACSSNSLKIFEVESDADRQFVAVSLPPISIHLSPLSSLTITSPTLHLYIKPIIKVSCFTR